MSTPALVFLTLLNILNYLDRYLVSAALPEIISDMSLTNEQGGRLVSAFVIGYVIFSPIFGYLGDRYRRPLLMTVGVFLWSLATFTSGLATTFWTFFFCRVLVGVGEASFGTIAPGYIKDRIQDPARITRAFAIFFAAIPVGSALGYVVVGQVTGPLELGWHSAFFLGALPGLLLCAALLKFPDTVRDAAPTGNLLAGLREILAVRIVRYAIGGYVLNSFALNGVAAFISKYGVDIGFTLSGITNAFGIILVATGFVGTIVGGNLAARLAGRSSTPVAVMLRFVGIASVLGAPFLLVAFLLTNHWVFLALCFFAQLLVFAGTGPINTAIVVACPPQLVTLTQGATILCINLFGALVAPILVGILADTVSLSFGLQITGVALLLSGVIWLLGGRVAQSEQR